MPTGTRTLASVLTWAGMTGVGWAQVPVPPVTTASPGGYAQPLQLDTDRYRREQRARERDRAPQSRRAERADPARASAELVSCTKYPLTASQRQSMLRGHERRVAREGRARADAWVQAEAERIMQRQAAAGLCRH